MKLSIAVIERRLIMNLGKKIVVLEKQINEIQEQHAKKIERIENYLWNKVDLLDTQEGRELLANAFFRAKQNLQANQDKQVQE